MRGFFENLKAFLKTHKQNLELKNELLRLKNLLRLKEDIQRQMQVSFYKENISNIRLKDFKKLVLKELELGLNSSEALALKKIKELKERLKHE
ncbi:hypothetical protein DMB92_05360 [Campylobacter sp. MIT 99-7217]|uniref:hypothetical protein n=1 Tax=Campylobacter sp. MIT 99-7217 TaxID=535091 RepID=UPI00115A4667|nr:hypothetical protein [Campylobacter sp. MIT 99-7217]TQR31817.1 hypothetical protein DMB92_05360 [Campylobacter sp. MIT 99-7217]